MPNKNDVKFEARLPKDLNRKLAARAEKNLRSKNAELIMAVQHYLSGAPAPAEIAQPVVAPAAEIEKA